MGALFLQTWDERMEPLGLFYLRYMDDIVVLAPSHWELRKAVRVVNQTLNGLQLEKHPEKTFIGKIERGFEFLGYHFGPGTLTVAQKTVERFVARAIQLYEQEPGETCASSRLGTYVQRWCRWVRAGMPKGVMSVDFRRVSFQDYEPSGGVNSPRRPPFPLPFFLHRSLAR